MVQQQGLEQLFHGIIGRIVVSSIAILASLRYGTGLYFWKETEKLERPTFHVIQKLSNGVEIRRYEPYLIAETETDANGFTQQSSTRNGFQTCARYIFGTNKPRTKRLRLSIWGGSSSSSSSIDTEEAFRQSGRGEKMAMTAPVRFIGDIVPPGSSDKIVSTKQLHPKKTKVSFVIGSKYNVNTVPLPIDKNVTVRQIRGHTLAVRKFSGPPPSDQRVMKERIRIEQALYKAGLQTSKDQRTLVYGYHDPFITPNFLRRNEVALILDGSV